MGMFWQIISEVGFYIALLFLILTIGFANSPRPLFQRYQFVWLFAAVFTGVLTLYGTDRQTVTTSAKSASTGSSGSGSSSVAGGGGVGGTRGGSYAGAGGGGGVSRPGGSAGASGAGNGATPSAKPPVPDKNADIQPSFVDASLLHALEVPVFRKENASAVLNVYLPPGVMAKKKVVECFVVGKAETSISSDRITITPQKLVFRKVVGTFVTVPFNGYVLDAEDGKPGLKARQEEVPVFQPAPERVAQVAKEGGAELVQGKGKKRGGLDAVAQVVRPGKMASLVIIQPLTIPE